jgi:hypothetical protein
MNSNVKIIGIGIATLVIGAGVYTSQKQGETKQEPVPFEEALDQEHTAENLGISFRYPSSYFDVPCSTSLPITMRELEKSIHFTVPRLNSDCEQLDGRIVLVTVIHARRAKTMEDVQSFIGNALLSKCIVDREDATDENAVILYLKQPGTSKDPCVKFITWSRKAEVVMYSYWVMKEGWVLHAPAPVKMQDGTVYEDYYNAIIDSIQYLPSK